MANINHEIWEILNSLPMKDEELKELVRRILQLEFENEDRSNFDAVTPIKEFLGDTEVNND